MRISHVISKTTCKLIDKCEQYFNDIKQGEFEHYTKFLSEQKDLFVRVSSKDKYRVKRSSEIHGGHTNRDREKRAGKIMRYSGGLLHDFDSYL